MPEKGKWLARGRTAEIYLWGDHVLKLFKPGITSAAVEQEFKINSHVQKTGLPVPKTIDIVEVDGRKGIIYQSISGSSMLKQISTKPWTLKKEAHRLAELHLAIHGYSVSNLPEQKLNLENEISSGELLSTHSREIILEVLARLPDRHQLCHGDFHPDNILLSPAGPIIIDWMTGSSGEPLGDVARTLLLLRVASPLLAHSYFTRKLIDFVRINFYGNYLKHYLKLTNTSFAQIQRWELPIAAARLNESIPPAEKERLVLMINHLLFGR